MKIVAFAVKILEGLVLYPENIERNLALTGGAVLSERVMIALVSKGMGRQAAHELMRNCNIEAFEGKKKLLDVLAAKKEVVKLIPKAEMAKLFDPHTYIGEAEEIVEKAVKG